ncbi:hypothetical protein ACWX0K_15290 [Nitrobacteraceae bacterium UC4446_H13]
MPPAILEHDLQRAIVIWLQGNPDKSGNPRTTPALAPGVVFWHTPNGGERRDAFEGKRLKDLGTLAGVHDLLFLRPTQFTEGVFGLLFGLELKKPGGRQPPSRQLNPAQVALHPRLLAAGMAASCVADNLADAKAFCTLHRLAVG